MKSFLFIIIFITAVNTFCKAQYQQIVPGNAGSYDGVHTNDLLSLSEVAKTNTDISGDPFWQDEWNTAIVYTSEHAILFSKVKLNVYTNEVWYITPDSVTMIAKKGTIKALTFFKGSDTTRVLANFFYLVNTDDHNYHFFEFMNLGKAQLVKLNSVTINKSPFDPFTGRAEQRYMPHVDYYIYYNSELTLLKGNYKDDIFKILNPPGTAKEWLDKNKNKLKSKQDILLFLDYFNTNN